MGEEASSLTKLIVFDCDSTLSAIEGVDEMGALRGDAVKAQVVDLTNQAMEGRIPISEVFGRRLDLIRPTRAEALQIGKHYIEAVEPSAESVIGELKAGGWWPVILSGGFSAAIEPLAEFLGIERIEAVPLFFDSEGNYEDFGRDYPTTRNGGKTEVIEKLKAEYQPDLTVMVGDGVSDLETRDAVSLFVGFGRYAERSRVRDQADAYIFSLEDLPGLLGERLRS